MVARDIALARLTGGRVHFLHLSTAGSAALVAAAKAEGLAVTAEVTPHHLSLTHAELAGYDPVFKVNPPLRARRDVDRPARPRARRARSTPSPPTTPPIRPRRKDAPLDAAPPGMLGLETALAVAFGALVLARRSGQATAPAMAVARRARPCCRGSPARIAGLARRRRAAIRAGPSSPVRPPTSACIDPGRRWEVDPPAGQPEPQHARGRAGRHRPGPPHRLPGRAGRGGRRGAAMTAAAVDASPAARSVGRCAARAGRRRGVRGRGHRGRAPRRRGHRRARVQHGAVGLPGGRHRPELRRPGGRLHLSPHRELRRHRPTTTRRPARGAGASWCATLPPRPSTGAPTGSLEDFLVAPGLPGITGIDTRRLTRHLRDRRRHGVRLRHRRRVGAAPPRPRPSRARPDVTW